jgi:hypothetical protein
MKISMNKFNKNELSNNFQLANMLGLTVCQNKQNKASFKFSFIRCVSTFALWLTNIEVHTSLWCHTTLKISRNGGIFPWSQH